MKPTKIDSQPRYSLLHAKIQTSRWKKKQESTWVGSHTESLQYENMPTSISALRLSYGTLFPYLEEPKVGKEYRFVEKPVRTVVIMRDLVQVKSCFLVCGKFKFVVTVVK